MTYELDGVQYVSIAAGSTSQGPRMWTFVLGGASEGVGRKLERDTTLRDIALRDIAIMGETRVDLLHLLEDLRDAYPWSLEETIVTEIVANALDSRATTVALGTDPVAGTLTVVDDGKGMSRQALSRYHDLASSTKRRSRSIGFAGVGIKLGLLVADEVVTETRRKRTHLATSWRLSSKKPSSVALDRPPRDGRRRRHERAPLPHELALERLPSHAEPLSPSRSVASGRPRERGIWVRDDGVRDAGPREEEESGIAVSTLGKVIKRGWDWLGLSPADASGVSGLIEVPQLADALILNKADFVRRGRKEPRSWRTERRCRRPCGHS